MANKKYILKPFAGGTKRLSIGYEKELNSEQLAVVTDFTGPCLVLAGAGSGKTRTIVYRVAYMLERGIPASQILLMTFTNKAAKEMLSRVELLLKNHPRGLWGGTFHHVGNRLLRMYAKHLGLKPDFTILDQEDSRDLIKVCLAELNFPKDKYFPKAEAIGKIISLSANTQRPVEQVVEDQFSYLDDDVVPRLEQVAMRYREKKLALGSLDYDDLLLYWHELLQKNQTIQEQLARRFRYILVDEYQDTNRIQGQIVHSLAGKEPNVLAVGDDSQSIYSFRGATVRNILEFPKIFKNTKIFKLEINYRSTPEILRLANESIRHNVNQFKKTLQTSKTAGRKPTIVIPYDTSQQADFICQRLLELHEEDNLDLNDMAVLFRAHYQSLELELMLNKRGIPYVMRGGLRFFEQAHIKDIIAYLKAFRRSYDELSWLRVLRLQEGIGQVHARRLFDLVRQRSNIDEVLRLVDTLPPLVGKGWQQLRALFKKLSSIDKGAIDEMMECVLRAGYNRYVTAHFDNASDRLDDIKQLIEFASGYASLDAFLADVALSEGFRGELVVGYQDGSDEAVTLSTVHQAKGLEWKVVFIIGLTDGQFPHAKVFERPEQLEEERRLFYVAATRAQDELYLTYPLVSARGSTLMRPSQFISEISEELYEQWDVGSGRPYGEFDDGEVRYVDEERGSILDIYLKK